MELFIIEPIEKPVLNSIPPRSEVADTIVFGDISWINLAIMGKNYHDGKAKYQLSMDDANNQYTSAYPCGECGLTIHVTLPVDTFRKKKVTIETKKKRLAKSMKTNNLVCPRCQTCHKIDVKNFSVIKNKQNVKSSESNQDVRQLQIPHTGGLYQL